MSNQASTPPLQLPDGAVDVWIVDLRASDQALRAANSLLNHEELTRARRFRFPNDRRRFVMARATARQVLGRYLQQTPESLQFEYGDYGKPRLASPSMDLRFNTSRSAERALIACTLAAKSESISSGSIGSLRSTTSPSVFSRRPRTSNCKNFARRRHRAFLRCWTCKEAFVKAVGKGLSLGLDQFDVSAGIGDPGAQAPIKTFVVNAWSISHSSQAIRITSRPGG